MEPKIVHIHHFHDDWCKTLLTRNMDDCKCNVKIKVQKSNSFEKSEKIVKEDIDQFKKCVAENN